MFGNALAGDTKTLQLIGIAHIQIMLQNRTDFGVEISRAGNGFFTEAD